MPAAVAALTGGTGFLGRYIARALAGRGYRVRILARRDPVHPLLAGLALEAVPGDLADAVALDRLVAGAALVIHAAGLVKAADPAAFDRANRLGSAAVGQAMRRAGGEARLVVISSLAARAPSLSPYAASKRAGEAAAVEAWGGDWLVLRPTAVYGPWDLEMLPFFRLAARGWLPLPGGAAARVTLIHAEDAAEGVAALAESAPPGQTFVLADATPTGYDGAALARALAAALGGEPRRLAIPAPLARAAGLAGGWWGRVSGRPGMVTPGKIREILHADWSLSSGEAPSGALWQPRWGLADGFQDTARWYRGTGLLPPR